jgi:hypothetical protein
MKDHRFIGEIAALNNEKKFSINILESAWYTFFDRQLRHMRQEYNRRYIAIWRKYMRLPEDLERRLDIMWQDCRRKTAAKFIYQMNILGPFTLVMMYWHCYQQEALNYAKSHIN